MIKEIHLVWIKVRKVRGKDIVFKNKKKMPSGEERKCVVTKSRTMTSWWVNSGLKFFLVASVIPVTEYFAFKIWEGFIRL